MTNFMPRVDVDSRQRKMRKEVGAANLFMFLSLHRSLIKLLFDLSLQFISFAFSYRRTITLPEALIEMDFNRTEMAKESRKVHFIRFHSLFFH